MNRTQMGAFFKKGEREKDINIFISWYGNNESTYCRSEGKKAVSASKKKNLYEILFADVSISLLLYTQGKDKNEGLDQPAVRENRRSYNHYAVGF